VIVFLFQYVFELDFISSRDAQIRMILTHISNVHEAGSKRDNEICIGIVGRRERESRDANGPG
jgi:hypothetical protein